MNRSSLPGAEPIEARFVCRACDDLEFRDDGSIWLQAVLVAAGNACDIVKRTDDSVHGRQGDGHVGIAARDTGVRSRIGICQRLRPPVPTGVFVGNDDRFNPLFLDFPTVENQVGVGVAETLLRNDDTVEPKLLTELCREVRGALLVGEIDILIGNDDEV